MSKFDINRNIKELCTEGVIFNIGEDGSYCLIWGRLSYYVQFWWFYSKVSIYFKFIKRWFNFILLKYKNNLYEKFKSIVKCSVWEKED